MKTSHLITLASLMLSIGCASHAQDMTTEEKLYGKWNCEFNQIDETGSYKIVTEDTYIRNGRANSFGDLKIRFPQLPGEELVYSLNGTADWEVQGKYLVVTMNDVKVVNVSHPGLDDVINLGEMFPQNVSESAEIVQLSDSVLLLRSESDNSITACSR